MPTRGQTVITETPSQTTLSRAMIIRDHKFTVDHETCVGCGTCAAVCPREAISLSEPEIVDGKLVKHVRISIDTTCSFCGECVSLCPTRALKMEIDGQEEIPVIKGNAFPMLIRLRRINQDVLAASRDISYIENCPTGALSAKVERNADGEVTSVSNVEIDRGLCVNCTTCMHMAPKGGIKITKPYKGRARVNNALVTDDCQVCAEACPTHALTWEDGKLELDERFCIYCGACQQVSPVEGAVTIERSGFVHSPIKSGAWAKALEKLVSYKETSREYAIKGQQKRRAIVLETLLNPPEEEAVEQA